VQPKYSQNTTASTNKNTTHFFFQTTKKEALFITFPSSPKKQTSTKDEKQNQFLNQFTVRHS